MNKESDIYHIPVKPMSINEAWKGRRFKTDKYKAYVIAVKAKLPVIKLPPTPYKVSFWFGFSTSLSDVDNPTKPTLDILCQKYNFSDRHVMELTLKKVMVKKGSEFFSFKIEHYNEQS